MEESQGFVSVVVPMKNAERYVADALASILLERDIPIEVIVVDDQSVDSSRSRVAHLSDSRIRMIEGPGRGVSACMNAGLAAVRGDVVMRCDADDLYPPGRIARQAAWLRAHPDHTAVCGSFRMIDSAGRLVAEAPCGSTPRDLTSELQQGVVLVHFGTFAVRTAAIIGLGGFREYFDSAEDIDLQLRLGTAGPVAYLPECFYLYRLHASSLTHQQSTVARQFFERMAHEFHGQRKSSGLDDLQRGHLPAKPPRHASGPTSARAHIQHMLLGAAWRQHSAGQKAQALGTGLRAVVARPWTRGAWLSLLALVLKRGGRSSR